ncbi:MAG: RDD family protein [Nanoarchaeota archaeon]|nr:RDD family protein [Nanoarchaeota archaeon]
MRRLPKPRTVEARASLFKRVLAFAIDILILDLVVLGPLKKLVSGIVSDGGITATTEFLNSNPEIMNKMIILSAISGVLMLTYFTVLELMVGQTAGKALLNLYVKGKKRITLWQALLRNIFIIPMFPFVLLWVVEPIFLLFSRRRLLEILTKTETVQQVRVP